MTEKSEYYKAKYGAWAGMPEGRQPDYNRCCEPVWSKERWSKETQCSRPNGHGPGGAYCRQHDPAVAAARRAANDAKGREKWNEERYKWHGRSFFNALLKIAEGHNDARGLAQEVIDKFKAGAQP